MKSKLVILIIVLSLLNIVLLQSNFKNHISDNHTEIPRIEGRQTQEIIDYYLKNKRKDFKIIIISIIQRKEICRACLDKEIELLNGVNEKFNDYLLALYDGDSLDLINMGAQFSILGGVKIDQKFSFAKNYVNPISIVVDRNRFIQDFHYAITGAPELSIDFYNRIISILQLFYL